MLFRSGGGQMNKKRKILWGGATASSQYEGGYNLGGKGLDTQDCRPYLKRTSNATTSTRLLTQDIIDEAKSCKEVGNIIHSAKDQMAIITLMKIFSY